VTELLQLEWNNPIKFVTLVIYIDLLRKAYLVERMKITENLTDLLLLELLSTIVFIGLCLATVSGREDHVINKFRNAGTVCICQNFGDDTLKKCFILKFDLFLVLIASFFFIFIISWVKVLIGMFLFGFGSNKAIEIC
jgi:hypothetical protein